MNILIVEDDQFLRDLYSELLIEEGYLIELAEDGDEGLDLMKKGGYSLVLLDIMLPKKDGLEILRSLSSEERKNLGPIVLLTNLGQEAVIKEGFKFGAGGYLIKSQHTPDQVLHEIRVFLSKGKKEEK